MAKFALKILDPRRVLLEGQVESVFVPGDRGEFELLPYHAPLVSLIREGNVVVDWTTTLPVRRGMVRFASNECVILVEEPRHRVPVAVLSSIQARKSKGGAAVHAGPEAEQGHVA